MVTRPALGMLAAPTLARVAVRLDEEHGETALSHTFYVGPPHLTTSSTINRPLACCSTDTIQYKMAPQLLKVLV